MLNLLIKDRRLWVIPTLFWCLLSALSLFWNLSELRQYQRDLISNQGRMIFNMFESVRLWNAGHGGVYAPVTESTPPNPYLIIDERDFTTPGGKPMTMVNPAYMTRQLSALLEQQGELDVKLTSLKPLNPGNAPRDWERTALSLFEEDPAQSEWLGFADVVGGEQFRYIAALYIKPACLSCHAAQGYQLGDIRGGLSVSFPTASIQQATQGQWRKLVISHLIAWVLLSWLTTIWLGRMRSQMLQIEQARDTQEQLVHERTHELHLKALQHQKTEENLRLILSSSAEGTFALDDQGRVTLCNPAALQQLGYRQESQVLGKPIRQLLCRNEQKSDENCHHCGSACAIQASYLDGLEQHLDEAEFRRADGSRLDVEFRSHPVFLDEKIAGAVVTFSDITERKARQHQIWKQANFDPMTGLYNRHAFLEHLRTHAVSAQRRYEQFALLFIDLDGFKQVNDEMGHDVGDVLLQEVARRLQSATRESDSIGRLGGDEFSVLLGGCHAEGVATQLADKLLKRLAEPYEISGSMARVSASIGIALFPKHGRSGKKLLKHADMAMYAAKNQGKNRYVIYQAEDYSSNAVHHQT
ncbi:MAG: diguanylate cyclase [Gammaproteobacteria bacterium]|nr:diguanylate cyclase [Gammaproteobacteria bacterium]